MKRVKLSEFESVRPSGLIALTLTGKDLLGWVRVTSGKDDMILITQNGLALRFKDLRSARRAGSHRVSPA